CSPRPPPTSTLFPYTTLFRSVRAGVPALVVPFAEGHEDEQTRRARHLEALGAVRVLDVDELNVPTLAAEMRALLDFEPQAIDIEDRKSTRLNSSHQIISYAVF